jgi:hypothetical protein
MVRLVWAKRPQWYHRPAGPSPTALAGPAPGADRARPAQRRQISDTHLSPAGLRRAQRAGDPRLAGADLLTSSCTPATSPPTIPTTRRGPTSPAADHGRPATGRSPGNHDVGGFSGDRFSAERLATTGHGAGTRMVEWGRGAWSVPTYRLAEAGHLGWLREVVDSRPTLFLHQPICLADPGSPTPATGRAVPAAAGSPRRDGRAPGARGGVGHLHRYRSGSLPDGTPTVWAPAASSPEPSGTGSTYWSAPSSTSPDGRRATASSSPGVEPALPDLVPKGSEGLRRSRSRRRPHGTTAAARHWCPRDDDRLDPLTRPYGAPGIDHEAPSRWSRPSSRSERVRPCHRAKREGAARLVAHQARSFGWPEIDPVASAAPTCTPSWRAGDPARR